MKIYNSSGTEILDVVVEDSSYSYRAIKDDNTLVLYFSLYSHVEIPIGAYCDFEARRYWLVKPENVVLKHRRLYEYTVTLDGTTHLPKRYRFRDVVFSGSFGGSRRLKFSLTGTPQTHLQMVIDNMNMRDGSGTWSAGTCIDATERTVSFNHATVMEALNQISEVFETEWEIEGYTISLCKVEYNKSNPLALSYGRGNGFKSGVTRNSEAEQPLDVVYTQGGTSNIDPSQYDNCRELLLPKLQQIQYDGEHFEDEAGFIQANARTYITDADGFSVSKLRYGMSPSEGSLDCSEIYPKRVGTISSVIVVNEDDNFYDFIDTGIPADLNFNDCLIEGETMTVIFQSGMLAGKEFDISHYDHDERRFEIVPQEIDGYDMPGGVFIPAAGDTYAVFNVMLPSAYICDNATHSGASWDMFREGVRYLFNNEEQKVSFIGELDGIWASADWVNIGGKIRLGGYVSFTDISIQATPRLIRITGIKDYVNHPHSPEIELSNSTVSGGYSSHVGEIQQNEVITENLHAQALQFTKRRFRDAQDTMLMLSEALLSNFTNSINPIAVQTMQLLVGDESLQFQFVDSMQDPSPVTHNVTYDNASKMLNSPAGIIRHLTLGISTIKSSHDASEYLMWSLPDYTSAALTVSTKSYYLYAKVSKTDQTGEFLLSETAIAIESLTGYYHLLVGVLNREFDGERSYVDLYGFTEILPGRITTDMIVSADGLTYFDLLNSIICGKMTFLAGSSGYNNIIDRPDMSHYILDTDGLINIFYVQAIPTLHNYPASGWTTVAIKEQHVGDLCWMIGAPLDLSIHWYRFEKHDTEQRYVEYRWLEIDPAPSWFSYLMSASKMFASVMPAPPYNVGDVWLNGAVFMKCITPKASDLEFSYADWEDAGMYDNTVTTINGGVITSGTIQLAGDNQHILAGITGNGTAQDAVRMWAGASYAQRDTAPFRVLQDGKMVASNAEITGTIEATSGRFFGSVATPPKPITAGLSISLNFATGFNFAGSVANNTVQEIVLPTNIAYAGVECSIVNNTQSSGYYNIVCGHNFMYSGTTAQLDTIAGVHLYGVSMLRMKAVISGGYLKWFILNRNDFSYDVANQILRNDIPSPLARCVGVYKIEADNTLNTILSANNNPLIMAFDSSKNFWEFKFTHIQLNKQYCVVMGDNNNIATPVVFEKTQASFKVQFYWLILNPLNFPALNINIVSLPYQYNYSPSLQPGYTIQHPLITGWSFQIFEFDF